MGSYLLSLQDDVEISENTFDTNESRYYKEVSELKNLLQNKSSAPKELVYPKFASASQAYIHLIDEKKLGYMRVDLFTILQKCKQNVRLTLPEQMIYEAKNYSLQNPVSQGPIDIESLNIDENSGISVLLP